LQQLQWTSALTPVALLQHRTYPTTVLRDRYVAGWLSLQVQALSHTLTREVPTLATLPTISGELAHTVYFPALLLQAIELKRGGGSK
jgi:hypothetical protein